MAFEETVARGSDALKSGQLDVAQQELKAALQIEPDNMRVLALLGLAYFRGNDFDRARPIYEALVERASTDASHRLNLGLLYLKLNDSEKAIHALEASRALDPSQGKAINFLGLAYARAGRYVEAYRAFLIAGQNELASEIETNLTPAERDGILAQLGRAAPLQAVERASAPAIELAMPRTLTPPVVARTASEPRTKPPSAPPAARTKSSDVAAAAGHASQQADYQSGLSHPEIVIEKGTGPLNRVPMTAVRSGASNIDPNSVFKPIAPSRDSELRMTESQMFVLPSSEAAPIPVTPRSMVSQQIAIATMTAAPEPERTKAGGIPPKPLSELATTELLRPEDGNDPLEIADTGALIIRITDRVITRLEGVHITGGDLSYDVAMRRSRGHNTDERMDYGGTPLHAVSGSGYLVAVPGKKRTFSAVRLDDDILYMREDLVFAFESTLRWESGNVPGLRGKLPVLQFRGDGSLAIRIERPLVRIKLAANGVVFIDADRIAGWIGRVIPRAVQPPVGGPMGATCIECTGEGIVLVEPAPERDPSSVVIGAVPSSSKQVDTAPYVSPGPRTTPPLPPPGHIDSAPSVVAAAPAEAAYDPELDMSSVFGDDPPTPDGSGTPPG